jgi:DNA-binding NarL/FixJ family response regulator
MRDLYRRHSKGERSMVRFESKDNPSPGGRGGRILLATSNDAHRDVVSQYLKDRGHQIVAVETTEAALMHLNIGNVDMLVAGLSESGEDDVAWMRSVRRTSPGLPIVLLAAADAERARQSVECAVEMSGVAQDGVRDATERLAILSLRERQVIQMVVAGLSSREIGVALGISCRTVENHRARIMAKVGVRNVAELVTLALRAGIEQTMNFNVVKKDESLQEATA